MHIDSYWLVKAMERRDTAWRKMIEAAKAKLDAEPKLPIHGWWHCWLFEQIGPDDQSGKEKDTRIRSPNV